MSVDKVHVAWSRWLLQTFLLWHRESSLHGDHAQSRLRKQVCVLLEVSTSCTRCKFACLFVLSFAFPTTPCNFPPINLINPPPTRLINHPPTRLINYLPTRLINCWFNHSLHAPAIHVSTLSYCYPLQSPTHSLNWQTPILLY